MGAACAVGRPATGSAEAADFTGRGSDLRPLRLCTKRMT